MIAKRKGCRCEMGSEGSVEQRREAMNKNRIGGIRRWTSWPRTAKSASIKSAGCRSGGCALKAVSLITGGLSHVLEAELGVGQPALMVRQKSAAGIVAVSAAKAQTEGNGK